MERIYFLPTCKTCPQTCNFCGNLGFLGHKNKTPLDIKRSLQKAVSGNYRYVLLPCNSIHNFEYQDWIQAIFSFNLIPLVQINSRSFSPLMFKTIKDLADQGCHFNFLITDESKSLRAQIENLESMNLKRIYSTVMNKEIEVEKVIRNLPDSEKEISLFLPLKQKRFDGNYSCYQLDKKVNKLSRTFPQLKLHPLQGLDQYDPRISPDLELEPVTKPLIVNTRGPADKIKISVIIPAYNNQNYIQNNIRHMSLQTLPKDQFELILVNDGSSDNTGERIKQMLNSMPDMNYKYFYVPRPRKRFMGDAQFRAGVARNLGVKHASGEFISFLDADIITPPIYLENLLNDLKSYDVIQTQRHYLKGTISTNQTNYSDLNLEGDTFIPEKGYWHDFYNNPRRWNEIDAGWKYVCTYSLTLSKKLFQDVGWFRKTYMFYGFEDTDLGYRLFKQNKRFKLSDMRVYHLFQHNERSEYSNSDYLRQALLSKTAQIFYRNYLDEDIFRHLRSLINDGPGIEDFIPRFR